MPRSPLLALTVLLAACGATETFETELGATRSASSTTNGSNLNGSNLNGSNLNGSNLNGSELDNMLAFVRFAGATLGSVALDSVALEGSQLVGARGGQRFFGGQLVEAELWGQSGGGLQVPIKITQVVAPAWGSDVWRYRFSYRGADGLWYPVCVDDAAAVAVNGRWDYNYGAVGAGGKIADPAVFTIGCPNAAIDKCVRMGYRPWAHTAAGFSLDTHHQACVRMVRADYCGNGISQTTDGRTINVYDDLGIQQDTEAWLAEAEWDAAGARCVNALNRSLLGILCSDALLDLGCGATWRFDYKTLLITETPTGPLGGLL